MTKDTTLALTLTERFGVANILPNEGGFALLTRIRNLREQLTPSDDEAEEFHLEPLGNGGFNPTAETRLDVATEVPVTEKQVELITENLRRVEKAGALPMPLFNLYTRLVDEPDQTARAEAEETPGEGQPAAENGPASGDESVDVPPPNPPTPIAGTLDDAETALEDAQHAVAGARG